MTNDSVFNSITPMIPAGKSLADALDFYTKKLGFTVVWQYAEMAGIQRGTVKINLVQNDEKIWAENASFSISVSDLGVLHKEYQSSSTGVGPLEMKSWGRREFHMIVPSGVCFQFYEDVPDA
jgi:catechol 2,3-dioxygenase-like lactoylglutathione lyase family enzyme